MATIGNKTHKGHREMELWNRAFLRQTFSSQDLTELLNNSANEDQDNLEVNEETNDLRLIRTPRFRGFLARGLQQYMLAVSAEYKLPIPKALNMKLREALEYAVPKGSLNPSVQPDKVFEDLDSFRKQGIPDRKLYE